MANCLFCVYEEVAKSNFVGFADSECPLYKQI